MATPPTILALDTSSRWAVVGVVRGVDVLCAETLPSPRAPSEGLLPMMQRCLDAAGVTLAGVDAVAVGRGPGSFTGTRIALATAKGLALGAGLPLVGVCSMQAAALDTGWDRGPVAVCLDARKGELLVGAYLLGHARLPRTVPGTSIATVRVVASPALTTPEAAASMVAELGAQGEVLVTGDGALPGSHAGDDATRTGRRPLVSSPGSLAWLALARMEAGEVDDPDLLEPTYSRPPPVHRSGGRLD